MPAVQEMIETRPIADVRDSFADVLKKIEDEPVTVCRDGKPVCVVMSCREYDYLQALDDCYWSWRAMQAEKEAPDPEDTVRFLKRYEKMLREDGDTQEAKRAAALSEASKEINR